MEKLFSEKNTRDKVYKIIDFIFDTCNSEVERINKLSSANIHSAHDIILNTIKSSDFFKEMGLVFEYSGDDKYRKYSFDSWLKNIISALVKSETKTSSIHDYLALNKKGSITNIHYWLIPGELKLILNLEKLPKEYEFLSFEYNYLYINKNLHKEQIYHDINDINLKNNGNFCILLYILYNYNNEDNDYLKKVDETFKQIKDNKWEYEDLSEECLNTLKTGTKIINTSILNKLSDYIIENTDIISGLNIFDLEKEIEKVFYRYIFTSMGKFDIAFNEDLHIIFRMNPILVRVHNIG